MARSDVEHYALLNSWPRVMADSSWHFNQISGTGAPLAREGQEVYIQSERDDIADALNQACELVIDELGFFPRPFWTTEVIPLGNRNPYELQTLRTKYGYLSEFTIRTKALVDDNVAIVYSDEDGDGVFETATFTVTTTIDEDELRAYFRVADGASEASSDDWEIEPLTRSATGGVVTFTGPRWLFVNPDVWAQEYDSPNYTTKHNGSTLDDADFIEYLDVYRVYGEPAYAVGVQSDPIFEGCTSLDGNNTSYGVARITNARLGIFQVRLECTSGCGYDFPESVQVWYRSGYPLRNNKIDRRLEINLIRLGNTRMPWQPDAMPNNPSLSRWQYDRKPVTSTNEFTGLASTPWGGLMTGEILAWSNLRGMALGRGGKVTAR